MGSSITKALTGGGTSSSDTAVSADRHASAEDAGLVRGKMTTRVADSSGVREETEAEIAAKEHHELVKRRMLKSDWERAGGSDCKVIPLELTVMIAAYLPLLRWDAKRMGTRMRLVSESVLLCTHGFGMAAVEPYVSDSSRMSIRIVMDRMLACCVYIGYLPRPLSESIDSFDTWPSSSVRKQAYFIHFYSDGRNFGKWAPSSSKVPKRELIRDFPDGVTVRNGMTVSMVIDFELAQVSYAIDEVSLGVVFEGKDMVPAHFNAVVPFVGCTVTNGEVQYSLTTKTKSIVC